MAQDVAIAAADAITYANATLHGTASNFTGETIVSGRWRLGTATGVYTVNVAITPSDWADAVPVAYVKGGLTKGVQYFWVLEITWSSAGVKTSAERNFTTTAQVPLVPAGAFW
jgi:hypothetical protein